MLVGDLATSTRGWDSSTRGQGGRLGFDDEWVDVHHMAILASDGSGVERGTLVP